MPGVLDLALGARDHTPLNGPLAGIRVSLHVASQDRRADGPGRLARRVRGYRREGCALLDGWCDASFILFDLVKITFKFHFEINSFELYA